MQQGLENEYVRFEGDVASSRFQGLKRTLVTVTRLNDMLLKLSFDFDQRTYSFRVFTEEGPDGTLFKVQQMVNLDFIIDGEAGFMIDRPKVHGGFLNDLGGIFFHISIKFFTGDYTEIFFFGKQMSGEESTIFPSLKMA